MSIEVTKLDASERDEWNQYVDRTARAMPFHRHEALEVIADASDTTLHELVGFKGQEPVGLLPLFETTKGPFTFVYSPPTELEIPYLGPLVLGTEKLKKRKAEKRNRRFVEGCIDWLDDTVAPDHVDVRTIDRYQDTRPFIWNDFAVTPAYTYVLDLEPGADELFEQFSSVIRRNVRSVDENEYEIEEGDEATIRRLVAQLRERFGDQAGGFGLYADFVVDLYERLPDGQFRPYVCRVDGEYASGLLALERGDTVYFWQGCPIPEIDLPVNDLLHWHVIQEAIDRGKSRYDLVGGMIPRLCNYKSKFGPQPKPISLARRRSRRMRMASSLYNQVPDGVRSTIGV